MRLVALEQLNGQVTVLPVALLQTHRETQSANQSVSCIYSRSTQDERAEAKPITYHHPSICSRVLE